MPILHLGVLVAGVWALAALAVQFARVNARGRRRLFAPAAGDPAAGVSYAFVRGMAPQAKESVMMNLPSYLAGMTYHVGLFSALLRLLIRLAGLPLGPVPTQVLGALSGLGALAGLALLAKRAIKPHLRGFSNPDDFLSNALATAFAGLGCAAAWADGLETAWMVAALLLFAYFPLGKLRHGLFFFSTRYDFGAFFGRRGTYPPVHDAPSPRSPHV